MTLDGPNLQATNHTFRTRDGADLKLEDDCWVILGASREYRFPFWRSRQFASQEIMNSFEAIILHYLQNRSIAHAHNHFFRFAAMLQFIGKYEKVVKISPTYILAYRATLDENTEWYP